jgi:thiol-disulfide isomerase/thioredoxin
MKRTILIVVPLVVLFGAMGIGLTKHLVRTAGASDSAAADVRAITTGAGVTIKVSDKPIPVPAAAAHLVDITGRTIAMDDLHGKVVLVNFWATWCGPCREEIPALMALQDRYRGRLVVLGLSIDESPVGDVAAFAKQVGINYPVVMATDDVQQAFGGIASVPSTFLVNPEGKILLRHLGSIDPQQVEQEVRAFSGLQTAATIEVVKDTGQVLLANAAYATEIPGVDLAGLTPAQKAKALQRLNTEHCTCGCNTTLAQCRINDPSCATSLPLAQKVADQIRHGG